MSLVSGKTFHIFFLKKRKVVLFRFGCFSLTCWLATKISLLVYFLFKTCDIQYINIKVIKFESKTKYSIFKSDVLSLSLVTGEIVEACEKLKA